MKTMMAVLLVLATGCAGGGTAPASTIPAPIIAPVAFKHVTALGDSITADGAYPQQVATAIGATLTNLGISGETLSPMSFLLSGTLLVAYPGILAAEVAQIPADTDLVTIYGGTNDLWLVSQGATVPDYSGDLRAIITAVHTRVPAATVVVATVPNMTYHGGMGDTGALRQLENDFDSTIRSAVAASGSIVVDLQCLPAMYDLANFPNPWDVHPNALGQAAIGQAFVNAIHQRTTTLRTCQWTS